MWRTASAAMPAHLRVKVRWLAVGRTTMPPLLTGGMWLCMFAPGEFATLIRCRGPGVRRRCMVKSGTSASTSLYGMAFVTPAANVVLGVWGVAEVRAEGLHVVAVAVPLGVGDAVARAANVEAVPVAGDRCPGAAGSARRPCGIVLRAAVALHAAAEAGQLPRPLDPSQGSADTAVHPWAAGDYP